MHAKCRRFAAFCAGTQRVLGNTGHGIDHSVAKLEKFFFLLARERIESFFAMVQAQQCGGRARGCFSFRFRWLRRTLRRFLRDWPFGVDLAGWLGNLARRSRPPRSRFSCETLLFLWFGDSVQGAFYLSAGKWTLNYEHFSDGASGFAQKIPPTLLPRSPR